MSTNAVVFGTQRIVGRLDLAGGRPRLVDAPASTHAARAAGQAGAGALGAIVEIVGRSGPGDAVAEPVSERLAAAADRWRQLTFYLFDPDSWR
ncbi:MAG TPA: hypothetical protein VHS36_05605 [Candidatus Limnocylindrales bacterium]|nr:hypothetical protein [Candidatus Limnocylindrales bacterium]